MEIRENEESLLGRSIVAKESVQPVAAGLLVRQTSEAGIVVVRVIEWKKFTVLKGRFSHEVDQPAVKSSQRFLPRGQTAAVISMPVHPFHEFGHGPIIEDARARVVTTEAFRTRGRFAHLLAVVKHDDP